MNDESLTSDGRAPRPTDGGLAAAIAPEGVAAILAIVVVVVLLASRISLSGGGVAVATATPGPTPVPTATPLPGVDIGAIDLLLGVNGQLEDRAGTVTGELAKPPIDPSAVRGALQQISQQLNLTGVAAAARLASSPGGKSVGEAVGKVYKTLQDQMGVAFNLPLDAVKEWTVSAKDIAETLVQLPDLDKQLKALKDSAGVPTPSSEPSVAVGPSVGPSPSASPPPSVAPSATPVPLTPPPATPVPTAVPSGSVSPAPSLGPNLLADGSFETGVGLPWQLVTDPAANASVTSDPVNPNSPKAAARIDITSPSNREIGIAYQQGGFAIEPGAVYQVSIALRSTGPIRIRIADIATGQVLDSRIFPSIDATWTVKTYMVTPFIGSSSAVFSVDVGRSGETVWVDDVSLARVPPG